MSFAIHPVWPPVNTQFSEFSTRELHEHIQAHGQPVVWEMAAECACRSAQAFDDSARSDCPVCGGSRFEYHNPVQTLAIVTPLDADHRNIAKYGTWVVGRATITMHADQVALARDRITLTYARMRWRAFVTRGSGAVDVLRHPISVQTIQTADLGTVTRGVLHLRLTSADGSAGPARAEGVDFVVTDAGALDWTLGIALGTAPAEGQRYAVSYYTQPRYIVQTLPNYVRSARIKQGLPERIGAYLPTEMIGHLDGRATQVYEPAE